MRAGADVVYEALAEVHVSGHARQEEIKLVHALTNPKFFIPIHGEYRHLYQHAELAKSLGMEDKNVVIANIGDVVELTQTGISVSGTVPSGEVLIDGLGVGDVGNVVLRDRKHLSQDGLLIVVLAVDRDSGTVVSGPDIISRGFVYVREADDLVEGAKEAVRQVLSDYPSIESGEWNAVKSGIRDAVQRYVYTTLKRSPMILPIIMDI